MVSIDDIRQVINDVAVDHSMWIGDDGQPLDYSEERESRIADFVNEAADAVMATLTPAVDLQCVCVYMDDKIYYDPSCPSHRSW